MHLDAVSDVAYVMYCLFTTRSAPFLTPRALGIVHFWSPASIANPQTSQYAMQIAAAARNVPRWTGRGNNQQGPSQDLFAIRTRIDLLLLAVRTSRDPQLVDRAPKFPRKNILASIFHFSVFSRFFFGFPLRPIQFSFDRKQQSQPRCR